MKSAKVRGIMFIILSVVSLLDIIALITYTIGFNIFRCANEHLTQVQTVKSYHPTYLITILIVYLIVYIIYSILERR